MKIIPANIKYAKRISELMLDDLKNPNKKFPNEMILQFREHAKEENIIKELHNPDLIAYLAIVNNKLIGFIVGYKEKSNSVMIHYITANSIETKKLLLNKFIIKCKEEKIACIRTDTFEFMKNNYFFKKEGFILIKKDKITNSLEKLWYELNLGL